MPENIDLALLIAIFGVHRGGRIEGRTRIQKLVCLLQNQSKFPFTFKFKPYYYGPYSDDLSDTINFLVGMKLIEETIVPTRFYSFRYDYQLTEKGKLVFSKVQQRSERIINTLIDEIKALEETSTTDLVKLAKKITGIESISSN